MVQMALDTRQPVSETFSVVRQKEMFLLNAHFDADIRLSLLAEDDAVIAWKPRGKRRCRSWMSRPAMSRR